MSVGENVRFSGQKERERPKAFPEVSRVDLNNLLKRARQEEKKTKRNSLVISAAALSAVAVFGIILTL